MARGPRSHGDIVHDQPRAVRGDDVLELADMVAAYGARLVVEDVAEAPGSPRHDPVKLAAAYSKIVSGTA